jgi:hypothetical protein
VSLTLKGKKRVTPLLKKAALHENQVMKLLGNADSALLKSILQKLIVKA